MFSEHEFRNRSKTNSETYYRSGEVRQKILQQPKWQQPERPPTYDEVVTKFRSLAVKALGEDKSGKVVDFVSGPLDAPASGLLGLLAYKTD